MISTGVKSQHCFVEGESEFGFCGVLFKWRRIRVTRLKQFFCSSNFLSFEFNKQKFQSINYVFFRNIRSMCRISDFFLHSDTQGCRRSVIIYSLYQFDLTAVLAGAQEKSNPLYKEEILSLKWPRGLLKKTMKYVYDPHVTKISKNNYHICGLTVMKTSLTPTGTVGFDILVVSTLLIHSVRFTTCIRVHGCMIIRYLCVAIVST